MSKEKVCFNCGKHSDRLSIERCDCGSGAFIYSHKGVELEGTDVVCECGSTTIGRSIPEVEYKEGYTISSYYCSGCNTMISIITIREE